MTNPLRKRTGRQLKKHWAKYLGMGLILVVTSMLGSAFQVTLDGAMAYLNEIKTVSRQEDGYFEAASAVDEEVLQEHGQADFFPLFYVRADWKEARLNIFDEREELDLPTVFAGHLPETKEEMAVDHVFARSNGIEIGDKMTVKGKTFVVCGTISLPDYTSLFLENTDLIMNPKGFGTAVVSQQGFDRFPDKDLIYRYGWRWKQDLGKEQTGKAEEDLQAWLLKKQVPVTQFLPARFNQSITFLEADMGSDGPMMTVFVYLLVAMIGFVFAVMVWHTIEEEASVIGTLRALGWRKGEILRHYLMPAILVSVAGSVLGNVLGYTVMIQPFLDLYYTTYSIGPLAIRFSWSAFLITTVLPVVLMVGIGWFTLNRKLNIRPLSFLRHELRRGKARRAVRLPHWSFPARFRMRLILRSPGSFLILFAGLFLSSFLLLFGLGLMPLMDHYVETVEQELPWQVQYVLKRPVETEEGQAVTVADVETWFDLGKKDISVTLYGMPDWKEGVYVSSAMAEKLNLEEGDAILLKAPYEGKEWTVRVDGIQPYLAGMAVFLNQDRLNEMLDKEEGWFNAILAEEELDLPEDVVAKTITRHDLARAARQMVESYETVIGFITLFSILIYFVLMFILTKTMVERSSQSIACLKVFGARPGELRRLFLSTIFWFTIFALVVCIPLELLSLQVVMVYFSSMMEGYLPLYVPWYVIAAVAGIGLLVCVVVMGLQMGEVRKVSLSQALKNRE